MTMFIRKLQSSMTSLIIWNSLAYLFNYKILDKFTQKHIWLLFGKMEVEDSQFVGLIPVGQSVIIFEHLHVHFVFDQFWKMVAPHHLVYWHVCAEHRALGNLE